ncbi:poly(A) polymerase I [Novimethylophilus kurashikiensis]|uniref:Poly(A) polymerase I n=1 Tax=Novimethylophilus kurashikiensis TaxID=1825523 RepID=A0A2R5F7P9_9PROT|nr:hypothetical protein [Novimethylophilus kurashikiensis]GBG14065.1 poly(A) polymerase I [Novimethylophilus kurashikiensis]
MMRARLRKVAAFAGMAVLIGLSGSVLAGDFEGKWLLDDTSGNPFEAVLSSDGTASGTHGDSMKHGTWKEENGAAVIHWNTGWTTRIFKQGNKYMKEAFKPGASLTDKPTNTSGASKKD